MALGMFFNILKCIYVFCAFTSWIALILLASNPSSGPLSPDRPEAEKPFRVDAPFEPAGDQPKAIEQLIAVVGHDPMPNYPKSRLHRRNVQMTKPGQRQCQRMGTADEQIRISATVKRELDRRKRSGESYNDVIERMIDEGSGGDFYDGFGAFNGTDRGEAIRDTHEKSKRKSIERIGRMAESRDE